MRFRPCIDIHNGKVKQIVGSTLSDEGNAAQENFVSADAAADYARRYAKDALTGGHIIMLNAASSPYYGQTKRQALEALAASPGAMQIGGGIAPDNAREFLEAGASHVIVTSYAFGGGAVRYDRLEALARGIGRDRLVLDLSCKRYGGVYYIMTDRWQRRTDVAVSPETLDGLCAYCDEFLVHAVDAEGKRAGVDEALLRMLGGFEERPVTYAGGVGRYEDIDAIWAAGRGRVDFSVGSALDLFGGALSYRVVIERAAVQRD